MSKYSDSEDNSYASDRRQASTMSYRDNRRSSNDGGSHFGGFRVYVGDIGTRIGRTDLEKEFGQYGPVTDVWMGRKREATSQNYAFVVYRYPEDAEEAVRDRNGRKVCGRKVRVEHAKPINSNPRRQRGRGGWDNRGRGDYHSSRGGQQWQRSRDRYNSYRRSRSESPARHSRSQHSPSRNDSFSDSSPKKSLKRSPSSSPEPKLRNSKRSKKQVSTSPSSPRSDRIQNADSDSRSRSSTPPPKKKKSKQRDSSSRSPPASDEYDARQYKKTQDDREERQLKMNKSKKKNYTANDYSSDDN
ncbi:serine/arginine-rich splicing factor 7-like [Physella acuta]|uniref:serine/arginine-rich splicing factor 7-like n=1 Tax=Physella acuta TaxID=109671 RepID=UPI0027DE2182|nr:serine/arginine-rich splicing factor 7-like [Physella acuta]